VGDTGQPPPARPEKSASAYRTIGEVAEDLALPAHVLRFWESKFPQLKPLKRGGGRRYYRPEDIVLLRRIRQCLYQDGYTIRGVQKLLGEPGGETASGRNGSDSPSLFPLDAAPGEAPDAKPAAPPPVRRPGRDRGRSPAKPGSLDPATRAALEEIQRELLEARAQLDELRHRRKPP
jgi:DNA-binding transcriptional MerR regulator